MSLLSTPSSIPPKSKPLIEMPSFPGKNQIKILKPKELGSKFEATREIKSDRNVIGVSQLCLRDNSSICGDVGLENVPPLIPPDVVMGKPLKKDKLKDKARTHANGKQGGSLLC